MGCEPQYVFECSGLLLREYLRSKYLPRQVAPQQVDYAVVIIDCLSPTLESSEAQARVSEFGVSEFGFSS